MPEEALQEWMPVYWVFPVREPNGEGVLPGALQVRFKKIKGGRLVFFVFLRLFEIEERPELGVSEGGVPPMPANVAEDPRKLSPGAGAFNYTWNWYGCKEYLAEDLRREGQLDFARCSVRAFGRCGKLAGKIRID